MASPALPYDVEVIAPYDGQSATELSVQAGERLQVRQVSPDGNWVFASPSKERRGWLPKNRTKIPTPAMSAPPQAPPAPVHVAAQPVVLPAEDDDDDDYGDVQVLTMPVMGGAGASNSRPSESFNVGSGGPQRRQPAHHGLPQQHAFGSEQQSSLSPQEQQQQAMFGQNAAAHKNAAFAASLQPQPQLSSGGHFDDDDSDDDSDDEQPQVLSLGGGGAPTPPPAATHLPPQHLAFSPGGADVTGIEKKQAPPRRRREPEKPTEFCAGCKEGILRGSAKLEALSKMYHQQCWKCTECAQPFGTDMFKVDAKTMEPYCLPCHKKKFTKQCGWCDKPILGKWYEINGKKVHPACVKCCEPDCGPIKAQYHIVEDDLYCPFHFGVNFICQCLVCHSDLNKTEPYVKMGEMFVHPDCWKCQYCNIELGYESGQAMLWRSKLLCPSCFSLPERALLERFYPHEVPEEKANIVNLDDPVECLAMCVDNINRFTDVPLSVMADWLKDFLKDHPDLESFQAFKDKPRDEKRDILKRYLEPMLENNPAYQGLSDEEKQKFLNNFVDKCLDFLEGLSPDDYLKLLQEAQNLQPKELTDEEALAMAQAFLERCMADPSHWNEFDNLPDKVKAIILDRFLDKYNMNLDAFKRLSPEDQRRMLNELLKHNVEDMDTFKKMSPGEQKMFMNKFVNNQLQYLLGLSDEDYRLLCESAMKKYKAFKPVYIPPSKPPTVRPQATGGPYTFEELRHKDWIPGDVGFTDRELYLNDEEFEKYFTMSKAEFYTLRLWRQRKLKKDLGLF